MKTQQFRKNHPRLWAIVMFVPGLFVTGILAPIFYLFDVIWDIPRVASDHFYYYRRDIPEFWRQWFNALRSKKKRSNEI